MPHIDGFPEYQYPLAGDAKPPGGSKVLLLTQGHICVTGCWADDGRYLAWAPLPPRNKAKEQIVREVAARLCATPKGNHDDHLDALSGGALARFAAAHAAAAGHTQPQDQPQLVDGELSVHPSDSSGGGRAD